MSEVPPLLFDSVNALVLLFEIVFFVAFFFWFDDFQVLISHVDFGRLGSNVKLSWKLSSIIKLENGGYSLTYETPEGLVSLLSKSVVFTVPSHIASTLLHPLSVCYILKDLKPISNWSLLLLFITDFSQVDCGQAHFLFLVFDSIYLL
jgi:hypothetical protein